MGWWRLQDQTTRLVSLEIDSDFTWCIGSYRNRSNKQALEGEFIHILGTTGRGSNSTSKTRYLSIFICPFGLRSMESSLEYVEIMVNAATEALDISLAIDMFKGYCLLLYSVLPASLGRASILATEMSYGAPCVAYGACSSQHTLGFPYILMNLPVGLQTWACSLLSTIHTPKDPAMCTVAWSISPDFGS
ncbi:hypothetical protein VNO77_42379 [Canavalia gladiata]|uniref:Uncharacterized protein n=1 Tax=Canavalia gladiata TaxID=3824 RepID=A0AAN9K1I1_CANGL